MYAEELKQKERGTLAGILLTVAIIFGILLSIFIVNFLQYWLGISWLTIVLFGIMVIVAIVIVNKLIIEYIYLIEKDRITFGRRLGKREKELLFVPLREIESFGPYDTMVDQIDSKKKRYKYTFKGKKDWYVINCRACTVILSPTQTYIDHLKQVKYKRKKN